MANRRRRRFTPRRPEAAPQPQAVAPRAASTATRVSLVALALLLLVGFWLGQLATFLPGGVQEVLGIVAALLSAVLLAIWYRRRARRYLVSRNAALRASVRRAQGKTQERD